MTSCAPLLRDTIAGLRANQLFFAPLVAVSLHLAQVHARCEDNLKETFAQQISSAGHKSYCSSARFKLNHSSKLTQFNAAGYVLS